METTITVREVLLLLLAADSYPCLGNGDWQVCDLMEADALKLAPRAVPSPDDPPEFGRWMETLLKPGVTRPEREEIYYALHEFFEPEVGGRSCDSQLHITIRPDSLGSLIATMRTEMEELQELIERTLRQVPLLVLERRLAQKIKAAGLSVDEASVSKVAEHILSGNCETFKFGGDDDDVTIHIADEDIESVAAATERFYNEQLTGVLDKVGDDTADRLFKFLHKKWPEQFEAQHADIEAFKARLETRWGKALGKLRMLLVIVREWAQGFYERTHGADGRKPSHLEDVLLRLLVRACQVTNEIVVLLENGYADGAMARWRTLHEITIVAAVIAKFGEELAERYVYYQIVESLSALKTYERNYKGLGFRAPSKKQSAKVRKDHAKALHRFGKKFGEEHGWAAHHLKAKEKERITFARLEEEAGDTMMRSPYKMASYNVHASPKGVYFKLGSLEASPVLLAGASNAGLIEPAQNAAVSLAEITLLIIGDSSLFVDIVTGKVVARLEAEIPSEFGKADRKLHRDDRQHRKAAAKP